MNKNKENQPVRKKHQLLKITNLILMFTLLGVFSVTAENSNFLPKTSSAPSNNSANVKFDQAKKTIKGTVVDINGDFIIGVNIVEVGTSNGTTTDINGTFILEVDNNATIHVSYIGYLPQSINTTGQTNFSITLQEDTKALEEVVVVGYGTQKKENLTGAVSTVDVSKTLEARPYSDISKALQGAVPGLSIVNSSGKLGSQPSISIRGLGTLSNSETSKPLIIVDGVPMEDLSLLNTQDIQNISVLKDAASTSIYGTRAAFGVILITTKSAAKVERVSVNYTNNFA